VTVAEDNKLVITRIFEGPPARVFDAWLRVTSGNPGSARKASIATSPCSNRMLVVDTGSKCE
jgi:hypothetical protein